MQTVHDSFEEITDEEVERVFRTNVFPLFTLCRTAMPLMATGGSIINSTSIQAHDPAPPLLHYASTKGAIVTSRRAFRRSSSSAASASTPWRPALCGRR